MPRRSNGCETCKRRKVKCDEAKPFCNRCARQNYQCEGYANPAAVRRRSPAFRDQTQRVAARAEASYARGNPPVRASSLPRKYAQVEEDDYPNHLFESDARLIYLPPTSQIDSSRERRAQMMGSFIAVFVPQCTNQIAPSHFSFIYMIPDILGQHPAIPSAVDALCMHSLGAMHRDEDVVAKSKFIYRAAISRLARNLDKAHRYAPTGTLAAILLLAQCELNQGASQSLCAWENHIRGAVTLLESYEPAAWDTTLGRLLVQATRYFLTCLGLVSRKSVALTHRPEWQELLSAGGSFDTWIAFLDIASQIPGFLEDMDKMTETSPTPASAGHVLANGLRLRSQMLTWMATLQASAPEGAVRLVPLTSLTWYEPTAHDSAFPDVYAFSSCRHTYLHMQYWFCMLTLNSNILRLYDSGLVQVSNDLPARATIEQNSVDCALDTARGVIKAFDPSTPTVSRFNGAMALKLAGELFDEYGQTDKREWCRTMSQRLMEKNFQTPQMLQLSFAGADEW